MIKSLDLKVGILSQPHPYVLSVFAEDSWSNVHLNSVALPEWWTVFIPHETAGTDDNQLHIAMMNLLSLLKTDSMFDLINCSKSRLKAKVITSLVMD